MESPGYRGDPNNFQGSNGAGHFTTMIWATTRYIGCHFINHKGYSLDPRFDSAYYLCNYGPAGNFIGRSMLTTGQPCSQCPAGTVCNDGLCSFGESGLPAAPTSAPANSPSFNPNSASNLPTLPPLRTTTTTTTTTTTARTTTAAVRDPQCKEKISQVVTYLKSCLIKP